MLLVTWNTQWCCGLDKVVSPRRIVEGARALGDFDVLCLQEIAVNYPALAGGPRDDQPALLRELLPGFEFFYGPAVDEFTAAGRQQFGNLIASRLPVLQVRHHPLPWPADEGVRSMPRMCSVVTVADPRLGPVRVMTTHLEFFSKPQRMAQARALHALHAEAAGQAKAPPAPSSDGSPFQSKPHTGEAVLCGDFNLVATDPEYGLLTQPAGRSTLHDAWTALHGAAPQPPTFLVHDRTYGPVPIACDFVFVSEGLRGRVKRMAIDGATQVSDHQPVLVELG